MPPSGSVILEQSSKLPSYSGFYVSKAISHAWALLKVKGIIPSIIPLEKYIGLALLTALFGLVSVLKGRISAAKLKEKAGETPEEVLPEKPEKKVS